MTLFTNTLAADAPTAPAELATPEDALRAQFERQAKDSFDFSRSRKGTYQNPAVARDWKWFRLGAQAAAAAVPPLAPRAFDISLGAEMHVAYTHFYKSGAVQITLKPKE